MGNRVETEKIRKAEQVIQAIAVREGKSVGEIWAQIKLAVLSGLMSPDPTVQALWKRIPCAGKYPEPEEIIAWAADRVEGNRGN